MPNVTWNPLDSAIDLELTNNDATVRKTTTGAYRGIRGTVSYSTGIRYFEAFVPDGNEGATGLANSTASLNDPMGYASDYSVGLFSDGTLWMGNSSFGSAFGSVGNMRVGYLVDLDSGRLWVRAPNGTWSHGGDPSSGGAGIDISSITGPLFPMFTGYYTDDTSTLYSEAGTITLGLPSGASLWGDAGGGTPTPNRKAIRSVCWL